MNDNSVFLPVALLILLFPMIVSLLLLAVRIFNYKKTAYYKITRLSYLKMKKDLGRYGEYETYRLLRRFEAKGARFLFNIYLPRENDKTTEIDVLMIEKNGVYVFESKNYSGWIFGNESQKTWTQTLPKGRGRKARKECFLNPVWQNKLHISALKNVLPDPDVPVYSLIVFSDRCELKNVSLYHNDVSVIHRKDIVSAVKRCQPSQKSLSEKDINEFYGILYPYTQVSSAEKQKHIDDIKEALQSTVSPPAQSAPSPAVPTPPEEHANTKKNRKYGRRSQRRLSEMRRRVDAQNGKTGIE